MAKLRIGPPVKGADFYDRTNETRDLWESLDRQSVLMLAPRRVGKTSLMYHLGEQADQKSWNAVYLSVADARDESDMVRKLVDEVGTHRAGQGHVKRLAKGSLKRLFRSVSSFSFAGASFELKDEIGDHWRAIAEELVDQLAEDPDRRWLVMTDEVPVFVLTLLGEGEDVDRARLFLNWFRTLRQRTDADGRVRWLLAGSIGLDTVTARAGLGDTINDLSINHLGPFSDDDARSFLRELATTEEIPLSEAEVDQILNRVGWNIPYYLQVFLDEVKSIKRRGEPARGDVVAAAEEQLLSPQKRAYFDYWQQRLRVELGSADATLALAMLEVAAKDPAGASPQILEAALVSKLPDPDRRAEKYRYLRDVLVSDGYLVEHDERFRFRSPLIRKYWIERVLQ